MNSDEPQGVQAPMTYSPWRERLSQSVVRILGGHAAQRAKLVYRGLRYVRIMDYIPIDGWLAHGEAITLYETARALSGSQPVVVEIGSWLGKSSIVIARGLRHRGGGIMYCIDPFNADGDAASLDDYAQRSARVSGGLLAQFNKNIEKAGVTDLIRPLPGYSHDVVMDFKEAIDFLFIDGNHEYEAVKKDFLDWTPLVKPGGYVAFHDVSFNNLNTGPQKLIRELVLNNPAWIDCTHVQGLFRTRKAG